MELHPSFHHCLSPEGHLLFWVLCPLLAVSPRFSNVQDSSFTIFSPDPSPELHSMSFSWAFCLDIQLLFPRQLAGNKIHPITSPTGSFFLIALSVSNTYCLRGFFVLFCFFKLCCAPKCHLPLISDFLTYGLHPLSGRYHSGLDDWSSFWSELAARMHSTFAYIRKRLPVLWMDAVPCQGTWLGKLSIVSRTCAVNSLHNCAPWPQEWTFSMPHVSPPSKHFHIR